MIIKAEVKMDPKCRLLLPCPFCGGKPYPKALGDDYGEYWFLCEACHCQGPLGQSKREAKILWNKRD